MSGKLSFSPCSGLVRLLLHFQVTGCGAERSQSPKRNCDAGVDRAYLPSRKYLPTLHRWNGFVDVSTMAMAVLAVGFGLFSRLLPLRRTAP
ncbi:hypothetical protein B0H19DRAFT_242232 [Mycena capillaripes]|nr:hypothetical protein B0H19DRAFT_242232 [Mycena capillaripes]